MLWPHLAPWDSKSEKPWRNVGEFYSNICRHLYTTHLRIVLDLPRTQQQWQLKVYRDSLLKRSKIAWSSVVKEVMGLCTCNHHYCQPSGSSPCISQTKKTNKARGFDATEFVTILLVPMDWKLTFIPHGRATF